MTDTTKHTPGPWRHQGSLIHAEGTVDTYSGPVWGAIAQTCETEDMDFEGRVWTCKGTREANARLIAAAPDLLDALKAVYPWIETSAEGEEATKRAIEAIAKAEGQTDDGHDRASSAGIARR